MPPSQSFPFKDIGRINDHKELNADLPNLLLREVVRVCVCVPACAAGGEIRAVGSWHEVPLYKQISVTLTGVNFWSLALHRHDRSGFAA